MAELPNSIQVTALSKSFAEVRAIEDLSFQVEPGEIFGLVGPDGAGKTTTLRVLAGVLKADRGSVIVGGHDVASDPRMLKRDISYMPQRFGLYEDLTVDENIRFCADLFGVPRKLRRAVGRAIVYYQHLTFDASPRQKAARLAHARCHGFGLIEAGHQNRQFHELLVLRHRIVCGRGIHNWLLLTWPHPTKIQRLRLRPSRKGAVDHIFAVDRGICPGSRAATSS